MKISTLLATTLALSVFKLPFMAMPAAMTLWYMSIYFTALLMGEEMYWGAEYRNLGMAFGAATIMLATWVDLRRRMMGSKKDFPFWLCMFGTLMFCGALSMSDSHSELGKGVYRAINAAIGRRVFTVFGDLGAAGYLGHLAHSVFGRSLMFSFSLMGLGLGIVFAGVCGKIAKRTFKKDWLAPCPKPWLSWLVNC